jgi:hypothetical protein
MRKLITPILLLHFCGYAIANTVSDWPLGSAMHSALLIVNEKNTYEAKSHQILKEIYLAIDDDYQNNLIKAKVKALKTYSQSACAIIGASSGAGGSWPSTYMEQCERGVAYQYYRDLKNALSCIKYTISKGLYFLPSKKISCTVQTLNTKFF